VKKEHFRDLSRADSDKWTFSDVRMLFGLRSTKQPAGRYPLTRPFAKSDCFNPSLKASMFGPVFRGLKPPVPYVAAKCNCSTRTQLALSETKVPVAR